MSRVHRGPGGISRKGAAGTRKQYLFGTVLAALALLTPTFSAQQHPVFARRGTLEDPATVGTGSAFKEVEITDLNDDQRPDFILPQKQSTVPEGPNLDILYLSSGGDLILAVDSLASRFTLKTTAQAFPQALDTRRAYDVEMADLDGDGAMDMIRPDREANLVVWWGDTDLSGNPTGTFDTFRDVFDSPGFNPNATCNPPEGIQGNYDDVAMADVDDDGDLDFVVSDRTLNCPGTSPLPRDFIVENLAIDAGGNQPRVFQIRAADPSIPLGVFDELPSRQTHSVAFGDVDLDSTLDVVLAELKLTRIYLGGVGGDPYDFEDDPLVLTQPGASNREVVVADLVDLNADTFLDVFVAQNNIVAGGGTTHGVYFHSGDGQDPYPQAPDCGGAGEPPCSWLAAPEIDYAALGLSDFFWGLYDARYSDLDDDGRIEIVGVNQNVGTSVVATAVQVLSVGPGKTLEDRTTTFMEAASTLTGGMGIDLEDLDNDGDDDMVLAGAIEPPGSFIAAATVYENRMLTHISQRNLGSVLGQACTSLAPCTVLAIEELSTGDAVTVPGGAHITLESGATVDIEDGFTASSGAHLTVEAGETLLAEGFTAAAGAEVTFEAGSTIVLGDGFTATAGSELVARIL